MNAQDKSRASELAEALAHQERLLDIGAKALKELNIQYDALDREYKLLLSKKTTLIEEVIIITENLDLYSNL
jgi:uncharacterized protein YoxC